MREILLELSCDINKLRKGIDPLPENLSLSYKLRDEAIRLGNVALKDEEEIKAFIKKDILDICASYDDIGLFKEADQVFPRLNGFFFRDNYDYNEGWNTILDDYRSGKIKSLKDFVNKRKRIKKKKTVKSSNLSDIVAELDEVEMDLQKGIDLGSYYSTPNLFASIITVGATEELRKEQRDAIYNYFKRYSKKKCDDKCDSGYPQPFDSYCESERTKRYWKELEDDSDAVQDFLDYIKEIKC